MWLWVLGGLTVWLVGGLLFAVLVGRGIRLADERSPDTGVEPAVRVPVSASAAGRGRVPLPTVGVALVVVALALETAGFVARLTRTGGTVGQVLSMDAPNSLPRLFVAGIFAAAAVAAVMGASAQRGRRTWWLAVGLVAAAISAIKAGSTLHSRALFTASEVVGYPTAQALSAVLAAGVIVGLWFLSRSERRDRRRVLGALSAYAVAVVGLSALSASVGVFGSTWSTTATFVEESGEALAGIAYLIAVLVGVAPQAVLPRSWALRRRADAESVLERLPSDLPQRRSAGS